VCCQQLQCGFRKGKKHLASEETHSEMPEFMSPSDFQEAADGTEQVSDSNDGGNPEQSDCDPQEAPVPISNNLTSPSEVKSQVQQGNQEVTPESRPRRSSGRASREAALTRRSARAGQGPRAPRFDEQHSVHCEGRNSTASQAMAGEIFAFQALCAKDLKQSPQWQLCQTQTPCAAIKPCESQMPCSS